MDNESQVSHWQRKEFTNKEREKTKLCGTGLEWEGSIQTHGFKNEYRQT